MPEVMFAILIFVSVILFAIYGFCVALVKLFGDQPKDEAKHDSTTRPMPDDAKLGKDINATSRFLNHLVLTRRLAPSTYRRFRDYLESEFGQQYPLADEVDPFFDDQDSQVKEAATGQTTDAVIVADEVDVDAGPTPVHATGPSIPSRPAPWEIPDPPPAPPKRSFQEVLSTFMLDKNIRWGELASGILIVGSAVGLVISLRNELQDTIPYFSALLFLLITAAINAAGIYTLKKWRLRNTSRGTLLIGLLLIPLNFLAACILSNEDAQRRELNDPLLWTAILVGVSSFSLMAWFSGKCLLRRGQAPLLYSLIGSAVGTLIIDRTEGIDESTFVKLAYSLFLVICFVGGTLFVFWSQWTRDRWPRRAIFRLFICFGIAAFAFINGAAMLVIRAEHNPPTWVSLTPAFAVVALVGAWFGHIIWLGAKGKDAKPLAITGLSMLICGLCIVGFAWIIAFANPTVLLIISGLLTVGFLLFAYHRVESRLLIPAWIAFASFVLCGINLATENLPWDSWTNITQLFEAVVSGRSGITLLLVGLSVIAVHVLASKKTTNPGRFTSVGLISGAVLFTAGLLLAIVASIFNRENRFDTMTASALLGVGSVGALAANLRVATKSALRIERKRIALFAAAATLVLFFSLGHAFIWNLDLSAWLNRATFGVNANWPVIFASIAFVLATANAFGHWRHVPADANLASPSTNKLVEFSHHYAMYASVAGAIAFFGSINLVHHQSGIAACIVSGIALSALWMAWSYARSKQINSWSSVFTLLFGAAISVCIAEILTKLDWCPGPWTPKHWLIQIVILSSCFVGWLILNWILCKSNRFRFLAFPDNLAVAITTGLTIGFTLLVGVSLILETSVELFIDAKTPIYTLAREEFWILLGLIAVNSALVTTTFKRPSVAVGAAIVVVWTLAWAACSFYWVDEKAVGTGVRWIIPVGGAVGACLVAARRPFVTSWIVARNKLGLPGKSVWPSVSTQHLINLSLTLIAVPVMTISTIAIVNVMMFGGVEALGGPIKGTLFGDMKKDVSYGLPVGIIVNTFLLYAISERRKWLATAGSLVFQYCVVLSVILLFVSPHPKLASSWFVNILQAVSVGMSGYGFVWWYFRNRVEGNHTRSVAEVSSTGTTTKRKTSQLQVHSIINGVLITSLAVLVMSRFFRFPTISGDWINSVGGPLGIGAWAVYAVLVYLVWRVQLGQAHRTSSWLWLLGWFGMVLVGMLAALVDRNIATGETYVPWLTFNLITWGSVTVVAAQVVLLFFLRKNWSDHSHTSISLDDGNQRRSAKSLIRNNRTAPLLFTGLVALVFAVRGMLVVANFWTSFTAIGCLIAILTIAGFIRQSGFLGFVTAVVTTVAAVVLVQQDPAGWFNQSQPFVVNTPAMFLIVLATIWCGYFVIRTVAFGSDTNRRLTWMPNLVLFLVSLWLFLGALVQWMMESNDSSNATCLKNAWGISLFFVTAILCGLQIWNSGRKCSVVSTCLWMFGLVIFLTVVLVAENAYRAATTIFNSSLLVGGLGLISAIQSRWAPWLEKLRAPNLHDLVRSLNAQLPVIGTLAAIAIVVAALGLVLHHDVRAARYLAAFSPFGLAVGFGCWSDSLRRRWVQLLSLTLLTVGAIFVAWADLSPGNASFGQLQLPVRTLLVLAGAMFLHGVIVSRNVRAGDTWLVSLKEMAVATSFAATGCLIYVIAIEYKSFLPDVGCGMPLPEAIAVAVAVASMIAGLIVLAARDEHDPFGLSEEGRMSYVYAAQLVSALLAMHLFFTMPFLFRFGIKEYWPYILLIVSFAGIGLASLLQKKNLRVLAEPVFNSCTVLPLLVALAIWPITSKADHALVMLIIGMIYLLISYTHQSLLHGIATIVFGNLALWLFYDKFDGFHFADHPQLWLIPPAFSVLIAAQISKHRLTKGQLASIRYICAATIYLSSTSEIFINGLGTKLWPPMVLALLSIAGIFVGILFQVRAYLYLGALFLLMAMITMISHAHQKLEHVWPWWAFGISMGIAILVMFGLFEKRKNSMKQVLHELQQWDP